MIPVHKVFTVLRRLMSIGQPQTSRGDIRYRGFLLEALEGQTTEAERITADAVASSFFEI